MANQITQRQLALAMCLGLSVRRGTTAETLSGQIDRHKAKSHDGPPNQIQIALAEAWGVEFDEETTSEDLGWELWNTYEDDPEIDVPESVQRLVFGKVIAASKKQKTGCTGTAILLISLFGLVLWLFSRT